MKLTADFTCCTHAGSMPELGGRVRAGGLVDCALQEPRLTLSPELCPQMLDNERKAQKSYRLFIHYSTF